MLTEEQLLTIPPGGQMPLWVDEYPVEDRAYYTRQLLTYIGNKRALLGNIGEAVLKVRKRLDKRHLRILDAFAGSGVVSRYLKSQASLLVSNDLEDYATVIGRCYLRNRSTVDWALVQDTIADLNVRVSKVDLVPGFIEQLYAPRDEEDITPKDRVFYTRENARRLDNYRRMLEDVTPDSKDLMLAPLLSAASIHANTAGVFKGFYKNRATRIGQFGGTNGDALRRIRGQITIEAPILSRFECDVQVMQGDANTIAEDCHNLDLAYIDPPYNQHPYGSNYFMLNLLVHYERPESISPVSGIPSGWRRSDYNVRSRALVRFRQLVNALDASFLLISFSNEGFIKREEMLAILSEVGKVDIVELPYNTFRGSRNLRGRNIHVTEHLFLVERR